MNRWKNYLIGAGGFAFLMIAGSLLHAPQWVAKAAAIFSSPMSNVREAYRRPYMSSFGLGCQSQSTCFTAGGTIADDIPSGYQLVIEHLSFRVSGDNLTGAAAFLTNNDYLYPVNLPGNLVSYFPLTSIGDTGGGESALFGDFRVELVIPSGPFSVVSPSNSNTLAPGLSGGVTANSGAKLTMGGVMIHGYLESCSAYPSGVCPALAR